MRFHGPDALTTKYWGLYGPRRLEQAADRLSTWLGESYDVSAYFNNDHQGHAVTDASWLRTRLAAVSG